MSLSPFDAGLPSSASKTPPSAPRTGLAFTVLALVQATLIFTITLINVPLPRIASEFALTRANLLLVTAAYGLPFSGLLLFGGRLADRYRGRRMLVVGAILFGLASLAGAYASSFELLVSMRFLQGVGGALIAPAAMAVLRALFPDPAAFGKAMATWGGVSVLGSVMGFVVSGALTTWLSWRWMFAVPALIALTTLMCARRLFPMGEAMAPGSRPGLDPFGAVFATLGISLSSYGLIASGDHPWGSAIVLTPLVLGITLLALFARIERTVSDPLLPPGFFLERCRIIGLSGMLLAAAGAGGLINFVLSLYLQQVRAWSSLATAAAFVPFAIVLIATGRAAGPLVERFGPPRVIIGGFLIAAAGLGLLSGIDRSMSYALGLLPGLILLAAGGSLLFSGSAVLSTTNVPPHQAGLAGGVMNTAMELGPTVGLATLMSVAALPADVVSGYGWAFGAAATAYVVAAIVAAAMLIGRSCSPAPGVYQVTQAPRARQ
ncbi:MFS transporter [Dyella sp. Tek66A03]|uniref:MFS transporter n=1 Tax=Dyella sp. Tek66A03 TaxID=3458298 RepID=UPI00403EEE7D